MKIFISVFLLFSLIRTEAQDRSLEEILNFPVGGIWTSTNENNDNDPQSFSSFFMKFENWSSKASVTASIFGVKNSGDTSQLMEVWNYLNPSENNVFLVQHTAWGAHCTGTLNVFEGKHMDIFFKTVNPDGGSYDTRDIHYILSENEMKAETFHRLDETQEWKKASESFWKREKTKP
ncbi:MAG: hypothetical protein ABJP45_08340 [Cyclobacteriaceae bacterium]